MKLPKLTVVLPTHNPKNDKLAATLQALRDQTLTSGEWQLLIIDNASTSPVKVDLSWHPDATIIIEPELGLTYARIRGIQESHHSCLVFVDDDNLLDKSYLAEAARIFESHPRLGIFGGKSIPHFEVSPPDWLPSPPIGLGIRDLGESESIYRAEEYRMQRSYPDAAPIGAGMVLRKEAAACYLRQQRPGTGSKLITDRRGGTLSSGGDCDIVMTLLEGGWDCGYFPQLQLTHLIPAVRLTEEYQYRLARDLMCSWVLVLHKHGISPWPRIPRWTLLPRYLKAWFTHGAWKGASEKIAWHASCGQFNGQASLST
ncbi:MAG: glycosyltransferase [Verrucomicrobiota bacterium]